MLKPNTMEKPTRLRISIYDAQKLKRELTSFLNELVTAGALYADPEAEFTKLPRFGHRTLFESTEAAKKYAAFEPDFKIGGIQGRYFADEAKRQYKVMILSPCGERASAKFNNIWFGPAVPLSVHGMSELIAYISQATTEIAASRRG